MRTKNLSSNLIESTKWTNDEIKQLKLLIDAGRTTPSIISKYFPGRSEESIKAKIKRIRKTPNTKGSENWTEEDQNKLLWNYILDKPLDFPNRTPAAIKSKLNSRLKYLKQHIQEELQITITTLTKEKAKIYLLADNKEDIKDEIADG